MGIDYFTCKSCGSNFPDCTDFVSCDCGEHWCDEECAECDGYEEVYISDYEDEDEDEEATEKSCNFCRNEDFDDVTLFYYALGLMGISREKLVEMKKNEFAGGK